MVFGFWCLVFGFGNAIFVLRILKTKPTYLIFGGTIALLLAYTTARACLLSMTHDESSTYLNYINMNIWQCFHSPKCWGTANLHWLNTLVMQLTVKLFGVSEFAIRLPNLLTHFVYLVFSCLLLLEMKRSFWVTYAAFLMLNLSPYLLDFFSLARGYGMICGWVMMSLYFLWKYIDTRKNKFAIGTFSGAFLAVMSNFVALNYLMALTGVFYLWLIYLLFFKEEKTARAYPNPKGCPSHNDTKKSLPLGNKRLWIHALTPLPFLVALAILLYRPIQFLSSGGEFKYGSSSLYQSLQTMVRDYLQSKADTYFGKSTITIFACLAIALVLVAATRATRQFIRKPQDTRTAFLLVTVLILLCVILIQKVQFHVMGTNYLIMRTALMLVPLGLLPVALCFLLWENIWASRLVLAIGIFSVLHLLPHINYTHSREWWYDIHTKRMALYVEKLNVEKPVKLGVHWTYEPTTMFYWKTGRLNAIDELLYNKNIRTDDYFDYYYVPLGDTAKLHPSYIVEKQFGYGEFLFRRKDLN